MFMFVRRVYVYVCAFGSIFMLYFGVHVNVHTVGSTFMFMSGLCKCSRGGAMFMFLFSGL